MKKLLIALLLAVGLSFSACQPTDTQGPNIVKEFDRGGKTVAIRVITYENYRDVTEAKRKFSKDPDHTDVLGWSAWSKGRPGEAAQCEIHVVEARRYMDKEYETWGHELAHCLYGNYHKEVDQK